MFESTKNAARTTLSFGPCWLCRDREGLYAHSPHGGGSVCKGLMLHGLVHEIQLVGRSLARSAQLEVEAVVLLASAPRLEYEIEVEAACSCCAQVPELLAARVVHAVVDVRSPYAYCALPEYRRLLASLFIDRGHYWGAFSP